jgi:hypothetical protein
MCFFDSPIARCEVVHELVLTDATQAECAREHGCPPDRVCPLQSSFAERSGLAETDLVFTRPTGKTDSPAAKRPTAQTCRLPKGDDTTWAKVGDAPRPSARVPLRDRNTVVHRQEISQGYRVS